MCDAAADSSVCRHEILFFCGTIKKESVYNILSERSKLCSLLRGVCLSWIATGGGTIKASFGQLQSLPSVDCWVFVHD